MTFIYILIAIVLAGVAGGVVLYLLRSRWSKAEEFDATKDLFI
jgi:hypothetical protein